MQLGQRADRAIQYEILRALVQKLLDAELRAAVLAVRDIGVDFALHHIKLVIDRRQTAFGLDEDEPVHAVGDVFGDHRRGTVVDIKSRHQCFPGHRFFFSRIDLERRCAPAWSGGCMEIDRMDHGAVGRIFKVDVDGVADTHPDERSRHFAAESPVAKRRAFCEAAFDLDAEQVDANGLRLAFADGWRQVGRLPGDVSLDEGLRRRARRDQELTLHARQLMARHAAKVDEVAGFRGAESDRRTRSLAGDAGRYRLVLRPPVWQTQDLQNRFGQKPWGVHLVKVKGDKVARALAAQATFAQLMVYAPIRDWSQMVIDELANFPKARFDDLVDSTTQAILFLRSTGFARTDAEIAADEEIAAERAEATRLRRPRLARGLYPC